MTAPEPLRLTLGQRVKFAATLRRTVQNAPLESGQWTNRRMKVWKRGGACFGELDPGEGVVVGLRTLSDGYADWESEVGYVFESTHRHRAVLIATHIRHKPVLALLEDVEPLPARDDTAELVEALEAVTKAEYDPGVGEYAVTVATMRRVQAALARVKDGER